MFEKIEHGGMVSNMYIDLFFGIIYAVAIRSRPRCHDRAELTILEPPTIVPKLNLSLESAKGKI
jgi:hypothetical protein